MLAALQSKINADLSDAIGSGLVAATVSFATGLVVAAAAIAVIPSIRRGLAALPGALRSGRLSAWHLLGGLGGAWLVTTQGLVVVVVGVTVFTVAVVAGQVAGSLGVDRLGLSPAGVLPINVARGLAGLVSLVAVVSGGWTPNAGGGTVSWVVLLAVTAGLGSAVQQAINARVSRESRSPMTAATVNFTVGMVALSAVTVVLALTGSLQLHPWPAQWWLYLGGPIGLLFIALSAWAVRGLGVLLFSLLTIAGMLAGSVVIDLVAPAAPDVLGWPQWLGLALIVVAVVLAAYRPAYRPGATLER